MNTPCPPNFVKIRPPCIHGTHGCPPFTIMETMASLCTHHAVIIQLLCHTERLYHSLIFCYDLYQSVPTQQDSCHLLPSAICLLERLRQKWRVPLARRLGDVKTCNMEFLPAPRDASSLRVGPKWIWSPGNIYGVISLVRGAKMC